MPTFPACLLFCSALLADAPVIEIDTLKGERLHGAWVSASADSLTLRPGEQTRSVPVSELLELRIPANRAVAASVPGPKSIVVQLHDGSRLTCTGYTVTHQDAHLETPFGRLKLPVASIRFVRLGSTSEKLEDAWRALLEREPKKDTLVVRKKDGQALDHLSGVIGAVNEKIQFLLDGDDIPIARDKVFALIYARRPPAAPATILRLHTIQGDVYVGYLLTWNGEHLRLTLPSGGELVVPAGQLQGVDFSSGKVRYLSQIDPRETKYTPYLDTVWQYLSRDRNLHGGPLRLGGKTYSRGLSIHSRTFLKYRLAGDYRRFQAVMGIDQLVEGRGGVHVVIRGDGRVLHAAEVKGTDAPAALDLDVAGVRDLEILVDFGNNLDDIADHLDLADAKVIK